MLTRICPTSRFSILPALSLDGLVHIDIRKGAYRRKSFRRFICDLLVEMNPFLGPNLVILDNVAIHKDYSIVEMVEAKYGLSICYTLYSAMLKNKSVQRVPYNLLTTVLTGPKPH
jgi:hypothetical protein